MFIYLSNYSCSLVRSFVHCGAQNSTSKKLASTNWDEHFDEETCTLVCEPLVVPPPPFPSFDFPLNNDEEDFGHLVRRATCTTTISTSTWSAFNSAISALANNGILCLNVGTITKSTGDTTIILPSSKTITIMSIKSGGTTLSASGTFGSRLFQGPSSTTIVTFDGITFGPHSQSLNSQGAIYLAGPATFTK